MKIRIFFFFGALFVISEAIAQNNYPWPVTPFNQNHVITGTFCEYRSTTVPGHFHNGTDIPKADGSPVYPVRDGTVTSLSSVGSDAYVRIQDKAYVHIMPNPSLSIGDSVFASQTVLGTILSGQGHVHLTNGYVGGEVNSMLSSNSLTPLVDTWAPDIDYVRFYQNNTQNQFSGNELSGLVDIIVKVSEKNGPPGSSSSVLNNGTYKIGYRILSEDSSTVMYEPPNGGLRFQFNSKPNNVYVNTVYFQALSSTSSHVYQVTNNIASDNYWDTRTLPEGNYVVQIFTEDTKGNGTTAYVPVRIVPQDLIPPGQPVFRALKGRENDILLSWYPNPDSDLLGYRLYFSYDNVLWTLFRNETILTPAVTDTALKLVLNTAVYFQLTAVDNAPLPNESIPSDIYGLSNGASFQGKVLLVDGFDRTDGAWPNPYHFFAFTFGQAVTENGFSFDTVPNESVEANLINLGDYEAVFWILGDESDSTQAFSSEEQSAVTAYLENGGRLYVSGSCMAQDLDPDAGSGASASDEQFLNDYLRMDFVKHDITGKLATGTAGSIFNGMSAAFGQIPYALDSVDFVNPFGSGTSVGFEYGSGETGLVYYEGTFGNGTQTGRIVASTFPFESITSEQVRTDLMGRILDFFFDLTDISDSNTGIIPQEYTVSSAYPNPFNPSTTIRFQLPRPSEVGITIYNALGQKIRALLNSDMESGSFIIKWNGRDDNNTPVSSGIYIAVFDAESIYSPESYRKSLKLLLTK